MKLSSLLFGFCPSQKSIEHPYVLFSCDLMSSHFKPIEFFFILLIYCCGQYKETLCWKEVSGPKVLSHFVIYGHQFSLCRTKPHSIFVLVTSLQTSTAACSVPYNPFLSFTYIIGFLLLFSHMYLQNSFGLSFMIIFDVVSSNSTCMSLPMTACRNLPGYSYYNVPPSFHQLHMTLSCLQGHCGGTSFHLGCALSLWSAVSANHCFDGTIRLSI